MAPPQSPSQPDEARTPGEVRREGLSRSKWVAAGVAVGAAALLTGVIAGVNRADDSSADGQPISSAVPGGPRQAPQLRRRLRAAPPTTAGTAPTTTTAALARSRPQSDGSQLRLVHSADAVVRPAVPQWWELIPMDAQLEFHGDGHHRPRAGRGRHRRGSRPGRRRAPATRLYELERRWSRFLDHSDVSILNAAGGAPGDRAPRHPTPRGAVGGGLVPHRRPVRPDRARRDARARVRP